VLWAPPSNTTLDGWRDQDPHHWLRRRRYDYIFGEGGGGSVSPIHHLSTALPQTLVFHGSEDRMIPLYQSVELEKHPLAPSVELVVLPDSGHNVFQFTRTARTQQVLDWSADFLREQGVAPE